MTYIRVVDEHEATGELKAAYAHVRASRESIGNVWKAESLHPEAMRRHHDLYSELFFGKGGLSRRERDIMAVAVSAANRCEYCLVHYADALGRYVKEPGLVPLLVADARKAPLNPRERALVDGAVKITKEPGAWTRSDVEALRLAGLADDEIVAFVEIAAYINMVNRVATGLGVTPEDADQKYNY